MASSGNYYAETVSGISHYDWSLSLVSGGAYWKVSPVT